jgi:P-type Cu+ transporter
MLWLGLGEGGSLPSSYLDIDIGGWPIWSLQFAIAVFVIGCLPLDLANAACPCGLALAAPTACFVGSGLCAKYGILPNGGGEAFQAASEVSCAVFDKTGTLTRGGTGITDFEILKGGDPNRESLIWTLTAELEKGSTHPLASGLTAISRTNELLPATTTNLEEVLGRGVRGVVHVHEIRGAVQYGAIIGNESWMEENGVSVPSLIWQQLETWKGQAKSVILLAFTENEPDNGIALSDSRSLVLGAIFAATDPIRSESVSVIKELQRQNVAVWMISGDTRTTAVAIARLVGIPENCVVADVLPHEKVHVCFID